MSSTTAIPFRSTVVLDGKTATGIPVPADVVEALGGGRQPLVRATVNGHTYASRIGVRGGGHKLPLSAENRARAAAAAGDEVEVEVELDTAPRELAVPEDLAEALDAVPDARRAFDAL